MSRVYVTQETHHLIVKAERFGEIKFITRDDFNNTRNSLHNIALLAEMKTKLRNYNLDKDFILPIGSPLVVGAVFQTLGALFGTQDVNILRWENIVHDYIPVYLRVPAEKMAF